MGDSILASLSLPPSGKVPSNHPEGFATERTNCSKPAATTPFITPVFGLMSNDNVPAMVSARKKALQGEEVSSSKGATGGKQDPSTKFTLVKQKPVGLDRSEERLDEDRRMLNQGGGRKRKQPEREEEVIFEEEESQTLQNKSCNRELLNCYMNKLGIKKLHLPEDPSLRSVFASCLSSNPRVVIQKLSVSSASANSSGGGGGGGNSFYKEKQARKSSTWKQTSGCQTPESPGLDNKE